MMQKSEKSTKQSNTPPVASWLSLIGQSVAESDTETIKSLESLGQKTV